MQEIQSPILLLKFATILVSLFSIVYSFGVIWRVEKKLDIAYKLFLAAILFFTISQILEIIENKNYLIDVASNIFILIFAGLFLAGILETRSLIRKVDGEK